MRNSLKKSNRFRNPISHGLDGGLPAQPVPGLAAAEVVAGDAPAFQRARGLQGSSGPPENQSGALEKVLRLQESARNGFSGKLERTAVTQIFISLFSTFCVSPIFPDSHKKHLSFKTRICFYFFLYNEANYIQKPQMYCWSSITTQECKTSVAQVL